MLVDSHAHLEAVDDLEGSLKRAKEAGVGKIITIGTSLASSRKAIEIADKFSAGDLQIYATCGLHPRDAKGEIDNLGLLHCFETLKQIAKSSSKVVGVGEVGLDYRLTTDNEQLTTDEEKGFQRELFEAQINLAADLNLPLIIHCRNGWDEIFDLIEAKRGPASFGVFHSFTGDWNAAQKALDLGFYISFSGIVTFKNAKEIQEVAKKMPVEKMLVETDSPYLSPEPWRGKINEPKNVKIVAEFITILRSLSLDQIAQVTFENAERLFGFENL